MVTEGSSILGGEARKKQREASSPRNHVWTTANAGSGKTTVLVNRVLRLLLRGEEAHRILCITYTKAGSVEMVERVRKVLGDWSMMDDKKLRKELLEFQDQVSDEDIEKARCLFLQVLDSPGGLQIHTFHGFCHSILGRFPLESGISPGFGLVEGERVNMLSFLAEELALRLDEKSEAAIKLLSLRMGENEFFGILEKIYKDRRKFERVLGADWWLYGVNLNIYVESMWQELDVPRDWEGVQRKQIELLMDEGLERVFRKLREGVRGGKAAERVREGLDAWFLLEEDERLEGRKGVWSTFFTQKNEWNSHVEKAVDKCLDAGEKGVIEAYFKEGPERLRWRYDWGTATESLLLLAKVVLDGYDRYKRNRGLLDYDDLIVRVRGLLGVAGGGQAGWVHFKLDGGIRHVLVDEAQDTDRIQWEILESLVHEFYAGKGVEADEELGDRTVFVVGDEKQSIFRFRGTEPEAMHESKERLQTLAQGVGKEIREVGLDISFRSGGEILGYVDRVFGAEGLRAMGVSGGGSLRHESFRGEAEGAKGFVMVLPLCQGVGEDEEAKRGEDILAKSLVEGLEGLQGRWIVPSTGKPLRADDVLFLFRKRKKMKAVMRELQRRGWSVTTRSDEKLSEVLAVVDVVNVLQVLLSSEDDYRLACVMKSPFVGWSDDDLLEVGYGRGKKSLWRVLRERAEEGKRDERCLYDWLRGLRGYVERESPYSLLNRLMYSPCPFGLERGVTGYQAMVGRLGVEAREALEMLKSSMRKREEEGRMSLRDVLEEIREDEQLMKKGGDVEGAVRLMTIHGSKGLEAPLVILGDTLDVGGRPDGGQSFSLWEGEEKGMPKLWYGEKRGLKWLGLPSLEALRSRHDRGEEAENERLLYVALTRARDGLVVGGAYEKRKPLPGSWYHKLRRGIEGMEGAEEKVLRESLWDGGEEEGWEEECFWCVGEFPEWGEGGEKKEEGAGEEERDLEEDVWYRKSAKSEFSDVLEMRRASRLVEDVWEDVGESGGGSLLDTDKGIMRRGIMIHRLLEVLPGVSFESRESRGRNLLSREGTFFAEEEREEMLREVLGVMSDEKLMGLFEGGYEEVPIGGIVEVESKKVQVQGRIDRMVVREEEIILIDYKSGRKPKRGGLSDVYRNQMKVYGELVGRLWGGKRVRGLVIWTADVSLDELGEEDMRL